MRSCYITAQLRERQRSETPRRTSNTAKASHLQQHHHILVDNDLLVMERNSSHSRVWRDCCTTKPPHFLFAHEHTLGYLSKSCSNTLQVLLLREREGRKGRSFLEDFGVPTTFPMCPTQLFPMMFPPPCSPSSQCVHQNVPIKGLLYLLW